MNKNSTKTIGLAMIVKDEAAVIERSLNSIRPIIDFVLVEDTGSTDGTQDIIRKWLRDHGVPGVVIEQPWVDFGFNRSHVLEALRDMQPEIDYAFIMDADDVAVIVDQTALAAFKGAMDLDSYTVEMRGGGLSYGRPLICSNRRPFRFRGVLHEYLESPENSRQGYAAGFHILSNREGARSRNPNKYKDDADVFARAIATETDPSLIARYTFYLAQSLRDAGDAEPALQAYLERAELGGWVEEIYVSYCSAAKLSEALHRPTEDVLRLYDKAIDIVPTRAEAFHGAAHYCRLNSLMERGYAYASRGLKLNRPQDALFSHDWMYDYGLMDEAAITAYWAGRYAQCISACDLLLTSSKTPAEHRERINGNRGFAISKQAESAAPCAADPEQYESLLQAALSLERADAPLLEVLAAYDSAVSADPSRAEALHWAARYCRNNNRFERGYAYAAQGLKITPPVAKPDAEGWIYDYGLLDEAAVNAYWAGRHAQSIAACDLLLTSSKTPAVHVGRITNNRDFSIERLMASRDHAAASPENYDRLLQVAEDTGRTDAPWIEVLAAYDQAIRSDRSRVEAYHHAARYCRNHGLWERGYHYGKQGLDLSGRTAETPQSAWIHDYGLLDEFSVNAYWSRHYKDSLDASLKALSHPNCPFEERDRFLANARFAAGQLPAEPNLGVNGTESLVRQQALVKPRTLRSQVKGEPKVLIAILAKQKEPSLRLYLECIDALDYPKSAIHLYIRTNNNTDRTEQILRDWIALVGHLYASVEFDATDASANIERYKVHEWNPERFRVLADIRNISLQRALDRTCDFYFVCDVDNFIRPETLRELVALNLPIVAPLLRSIQPDGPYANYHAEIDALGYYKPCDQYHWILNRWVRGVFEAPVIHCTYLIRADLLPLLNYNDGSDRHEYVVFSDIARKADVPQYIDNRQVYGYITFDADDGHYVEGGIDQARALIMAR